MSLLIVFAGAGGTPADTGTLGFAALPATLSLGVQNTPPAATETLGFASLPATLAFGVLNTNPETLGVVSFPATVAFGVQNTPPPATETLGFASFPATLSFGVVAANNAGSFAIIAQPAVLSFGVQQSLGETLGFVSLPATLGFNVTASGGSVLPLDYIAAIVAFWYSDPTLLAAFPGIDGAGSRGLLVGESDESVPMPRCVLNYVGGRRSGSTGRPYLVWHTIQFSIFAGDYETSRNDAYLVHDKYHKLILAFQNGIMKSAALEEPFLAPNTVLPSFGATTAFDHVVEGRYLIQRNVGPYPP